MSIWVGIEAWEDEEARREDDWRDAWDQLELEQEPPDLYEPPCVACDGSGARCCDVAAMGIPARPEGGERDG